MSTNFYWNRFVFDRHKAQNRLAQVFWDTWKCVGGYVCKYVRDAVPVFNTIWFRAVKFSIITRQEDKRYWSWWRSRFAGNSFLNFDNPSNKYDNTYQSFVDVCSWCLNRQSLQWVGHCRCERRKRARVAQMLRHYWSYCWNSIFYQEFARVEVLRKSINSFICGFCIEFQEGDIMED